MPLEMPPVYVPGSFYGEPVAPLGYTGPSFTFDAVTELIQPGSDGRMVVLGTPIAACNLQLETPPEDPDYPLYFESTGRTYHYVVSIWSDRVMIDVCDREEFKRQSAMFPTTEEQLRRALETMVADCSQ